MHLVRDYSSSVIVILLCIPLHISQIYRIQVSEKTYKDSFDDELEQFKDRIKTRAHEKLQEAIREQEEEQRKARLGPGGLDPVEVYEELPDVCLNHYYINKRTSDGTLT